MPETTQTQCPVVIKDRDGKSIAVRSVQANIILDGPVGRAAMEVTFNNDTDTPIEGDLVFPLPPFASVENLQVRVGGREIDGKFKPRERAQADYDRAVQAGHTAVLGETEGEDLCRLRVAPIDKGEDVVVRLSVVHPLTPTADGYRLIVPLTYMPRYVEDEAELKPTEKAAVDRPRPLTLAARAQVAVSVLGARGKTKAVCRTHQLDVAETPEGTTFRVKDAPLDADLHITISDASPGAEPTVWVRHDAGAGADNHGPTTAVALVPPAIVLDGVVIARDVLFLVDRSGSMGSGFGQARSKLPMDSALEATRGCLRALGEKDRFNIIAFDDRLESLAKGPVPYDDANLAAAEAFLSGIHARGSTDASMALEAALGGTNLGEVATSIETPPDPNLRLRVIILMTDGDVSGAEAVIRTAREKMHDTRMFVVGIGYSVQHSLLASLAEAGRGIYCPVGQDDLESVVGRIKSAIDAPLLTGVKVRLDQGGDVVDADKVESLGALDLFAGEPLMLAFRGALAAGTKLILSGQRAGGEDYRVVVPVDAAQDAGSDGSVAARLWAMLRNKRLSYRFDPKDDAALEELGVAFGLANRRTALVGVHSDPRGIKPTETIPVVLPMPRNLAAESDQGGLESLQTLGGAPKGAMAFAAPICAVAGASGPARGIRSRGLAGGTMRGAALGATLSASADRGATLCAESSEDWMDSEPTRGNISASVPGAYAALDSMVAGPRFTDDMAGLRHLVLLQGASGLWADCGATLMAVLALVGRGHTARQGDFRGELRKTEIALAKLMAQNGLPADQMLLVCAALAILRRADGVPAPDVDAQIDAQLDRINIQDIPDRRSRVRMLATLMGPMVNSNLAQEIRSCLLG